MKKDKKISNLRALSIILVVIAHSIIIYRKDWNLYKTLNVSPIFDNMCTLIYCFHMPLFFSISGYLFGNSYKNISLKELIRKKAKRLLIPYLFVGILFLYPIRCLSNYTGYENNSYIYNILVNIVLGVDNGHLWFLPSLFFMFIAGHLIQTKIKKNNIKYLIPFLMLIISHIIPTWIGTTLNNYIWFHFGIIINEKKIDKKIDKKNKKSYITLLIVILLLLYLLTYYKNGKIAVILKTIINIILIPVLYGTIPNKNNKILDYISDNSFGIYLFHSPLIYLTFEYLPNINPLFIFFINFFLWGTCSIVITSLLNKTKLKFMIGG